LFPEVTKRASARIVHADPVTDRRALAEIRIDGLNGLNRFSGLNGF
jgi:hypothetical protein